MRSLSPQLLVFGMPAPRAHIHASLNSQVAKSWVVLCPVDFKRRVSAFWADISSAAAGHSGFELGDVRLQVFHLVLQGLQALPERQFF